MSDLYEGVDFHLKCATPNYQQSGKKTEDAGQKARSSCHVVAGDSVKPSNRTMASIQKAD
jgi:hypothetical protein